MLSSCALARAKSTSWLLRLVPCGSGLSIIGLSIEIISFPNSLRNSSDLFSSFAFSTSFKAAPLFVSLLPSFKSRIQPLTSSLVSLSALVKAAGILRIDCTNATFALSRLSSVWAHASFICLMPSSKCIKRPAISPPIDPTAAPTAVPTKGIKLPTVAPSAPPRTAPPPISKPFCCANPRHPSNCNFPTRASVISPSSFILLINSFADTPCPAATSPTVMVPFNPICSPAPATGLRSLFSLSSPNTHSFIYQSLPLNISSSSLVNPPLITLTSSSSSSVLAKPNL